MKILSGSSNLPLAKAVAKKLQLPLLPREIFIFPDGERRIRLEESVVDEHVVIVQPTSPPVDTHYFELFLLSDAVKRSGAASVTAIIPYLGYQRQDHLFRDGEAVSLEVIVKTMESVGIDRVISFDLHSIKIPEVFSIPVTHLSALPLFAKQIKKEKWLNRDTQLVTPDMGGVRRVDLLAQLLPTMQYSCIKKSRDLATGKVSASDVVGEIKRRMIIVDDMISSGGTIIKAAELLKEKGAEEIYVFATHAIFSEKAPELLQNSVVKKVYLTDTVDIPKAKQFPKLEILSIASMIAENLS